MISEKVKSKVKFGVVAFVVLLAVAAFTGCASAKTITVDDDPGADYTSIQDAVDAAEPYDIIYVYDGLYIENVKIVNSSLTLTAESKDAIVEGGWSGNCFYVTGDTINISGFTIQNSGSSYRGVYLYGSSNSEIVGNDVINNGYGVYLYSYCEHNTIKNNYIADSNKDGIHLSHYYNEYNTIADNTVTRNKDGIHLTYGGHNDYNTIENNAVDSNRENGIYLYSQNNYNTIANNSFNSNGINGIKLGSGGNDQIINNTVTSNKDVGIYLSHSSDTIIKENSVDRNKGGIYLYSTSKNCEITENNITHSTDYGLYLHSGSSINKIYHNNFIGNFKQAEEYESSNSFDKGSTIGGNYWSDHVCTGNPSNGSQPYIIPPYGHKDRYPFENINGWMMKDTTPPASITNLQNTTGQTWINWTWTNPADADFSYVMVYLDGTWQTNTSNPFYNATGLDPDTYYEIGTHTVDKVGNVNMTWVNQTTKTQAPPDLTINDIWVNWLDNCTICYNVTNIGNGTAPAGHNTSLFVEGEEVAHDLVDENLAPNASYIGCFVDYNWTYTPPEDNITVCADNNNTVEESNETNNCLTNTWKCGDVNEDGRVTMSDVRKVYNRYLDPSYPLCNEWAVDVNCDGRITMSDVRKVYNRYLDPSYDLNCCCEQVIE